MNQPAVNQTQKTQSPPPKFRGLKIFAIVVLSIVVAVFTSIIVIRLYVFPSEFKPVSLNTKEEKKLEKKLHRLGWKTDETNSQPLPLTPQKYTEEGADREIRFSQKELNSLIASRPDIASRVAIGLDDNLASAKILIPIPNDFPVMAGETLRVNAGLELSLDSRQKPVVILRGVSIMGVPVPNAWLGNLKNVDLVSEFGDSGFWKAFAEGVEDLHIDNGSVYIKLRE